MKYLGLIQLIKSGISSEDDPYPFYKLNDIPKFPEIKMNKHLLFECWFSQLICKYIERSSWHTRERDCELGGLINSTSGQLSDEINVLPNAPLSGYLFHDMLYMG